MAVQAGTTCAKGESATFTAKNVTILACSLTLYWVGKMKRCIRPGGGKKFEFYILIWISQANFCYQASSIQSDIYSTDIIVLKWVEGCGCISFYDLLHISACIGFSRKKDLMYSFRLCEKSLVSLLNEGEPKNCYIYALLYYGCLHWFNFHLWHCVQGLIFISSQMQNKTWLIYLW